MNNFFIYGEAGVSREDVVTVTVIVTGAFGSKLFDGFAAELIEIVSGHPLFYRVDETFKNGRGYLAGFADRLNFFV